MKLATIEAMFPELKGGDIYKSGRGKGSSSRVAIGRAFGDLLKKVSKKRVTSIKCTVTIVDCMPEEATDENH
jgi:hypothetical protein